MSYRNSGSTFASSLASDESYIGTLPIVSLLEDVDGYAANVFDNSAKTIHDLQQLETLKSNRGEVVDWKRLGEREMLLTGFLHCIEKVQEELADMLRADFAALSLVWGSCAELVGQALEDIITKLAGIERRVVGLRENFDGKSHASSAQSRSETAAELSARHMSLMNADTSGRAIRYRRDIHPCRGALQLIKGDDRGGIDQCHKKDMTPAELDRLRKGGTRGTFLFWTCDSCQFRIKYFVSKSCAASLLANDEVLTFHDSKIRCSRAFLVMSHLEQRDTKRISSSPRYTCVICALHRPSTRPDRNRTFSTRDDYVKHVEDVHINGEPLPAFLLQKLCIENGDRLPHGHRRDLWTA